MSLMASSFSEQALACKILVLLLAVAGKLSQESCDFAKFVLNAAGITVTRSLHPHPVTAYPITANLEPISSTSYH